MIEVAKLRCPQDFLCVFRLRWIPIDRDKGGEIYEVPSPLVGEGKGEGYINSFLTFALVI
jgi:hypothetical protein